MSWIRFVLRFDDLLPYHPLLHGHYSLQRYYDGSDCCQPSRDVPALAALLCSRHNPCLTYDHQPPQHSPRQVPYLPSRTDAQTLQGFAIPQQARRFVVAESCSLALSSIRFFSLLSTPPHGDAVTSSSHPEHGSKWPRSSTSEDCDASQRTETDTLVCPHVSRQECLHHGQRTFCARVIPAIIKFCDFPQMACVRKEICGTNRISQKLMTRSIAAPGMTSFYQPSILRSLATSPT